MIKWWGKRRKVSRTNTNNQIPTEVAKAEKDLSIVERKLEADRSRAKELAKAVASARRVSYRVDLFTDEIRRSFGRVNHG